jgi:hypothetical protein
MIAHYFSLQYRLLNRRIRDTGFILWLFYPLALVIFNSLSHLIFQRISYAAYVYTFLGLLMTSGMSEVKRNEFLHICYPKKIFFQIRMMENLIIILPFLTYLIFRKNYVPAVILPAFSLALAFTRVRIPESKPIPTPFSRYPFEFAAGFRNSLPVIIAAYCLTGIGIQVGNHHLALFSLVVLYLTILTYFVKPEPDVYVWMYPLPPASFLWRKIRRALLQSLVLNALPAIAIGMADITQLNIVLLTVTVGALFLVMIILAKYAAFPNEMNMAQAIVLAVCFSFPPLVMLTIPYFFYQSVQRLNQYLR